MAVAIAGQLLTALILDHFQLFGFRGIPLNHQDFRAVLMLLGTWLIIRYLAGRREAHALAGTGSEKISYLGHPKLRAVRFSLSRCLSRFDLIIIGVAQIIGAGIFVIVGVGVQVAGPGIVISFVISGLAAMLAALCYAEMAAMHPVAGGAYSYAYAIFGEIFAWIIGWDLILEYGMGAATAAVGWSYYFQELLRAWT